MIILIFIFPLAYILGSVPSSVWIGKGLKGIDLREHGSGNAGATNAFRILGTTIGVMVLVMDMLKGYLAVSLANLQDEIVPDSEGWIILRIGLGLLAVAGHIYPLFAGFKGGKGVATTAGVALALHPFTALAAMGVYLTVFLIFKLSALGSLLAVLSYPFWVIFVFHVEYKAFWVFAILVPILTFITHRSNIQRLIHKEERSVFRRS